MKNLIKILVMIFSFNAYPVTWSYHANSSTEEPTTTTLGETLHLFYLDKKISCLIIPTQAFENSFLRTLSCELTKDINVSTTARCTENRIIDSGFMALYIGRKTYYVGLNCVP